jgi:NADH-quinone oxidoreductase subunit A
MTPLFAALVLFFFVLAFGLLLVWVSGLLGPKTKFDKVKNESYECGLPVQETGNTKIPVKFYLTAILFILFDIEIIFMYPWAVSFIEFVQSGAGLYIMGVMGVFLAIFIYGLFWEIKSNALEWE